MDNFLATHPVFTVEELSKALQRNESSSPQTRKALLAYHGKRGHIVQIRRGLYSVVPPGASPDTSPVDPYVAAARMTDDAVLGYHTALEVHGKAHSVSEQFVYLAKRPARPAKFRSYTFKGVRFPKALCDRHCQDLAVQTAERAGLDIRVTSLERTLVDVLDRPDLGGGWEEIWRSLESVEYFNLEKVVEYALLLGNATTVAKAGYFLDQHRQALMVEDVHLEPLRSRRPKRPHYMDRSRRGNGRLVSEWNLVVPVYVAERSWEERP
jgi:predicted transcriptional regulator of viral defense system